MERRRSGYNGTISVIERSLERSVRWQGVSGKGTRQRSGSELSPGGFHQVSADDELLHFGGAFIDAQGPDLAIETLRDLPDTDTAPAEKLQRLVDYPLGVLCRGHLGHGGFPCHFLPRGLHPGSLHGEQLRGFNLGGHVCQLKRNALEITNGLVKLLALYRGIKFTLISPPMLEMPSYIIEQISRNDHVIEQTHDLSTGLRGADVVYATRIQKERFTDESFEGYTPDFQVNKAIIDKCCGPDVIVMHPLPRDSREGANDLSVDLNHDPRLAIFRQTDNGIPVRMAIFAVLLGVEGLVQHSLRDVTWAPPSHVGPDDSPFHGLD